MDKHLLNSFLLNKTRAWAPWLLAAIAWLVFGHAALAQTITIPAANTSSGVNRFPLGTFYGYDRTAMLYTSAEIGQGGTISSVGFYINAVVTPGAAPTKVYLKETMATSFTASTTVAAEQAGATLVYNATLPASSFVAGQWVTIPLTTPFAYSGNATLEVIVETNAGGNGNEVGTGKGIRYSTIAARTQTWSADGTPPSSTGNITSSRPNIQLNLMAASPCTSPPTPGTVSVSNPNPCSGSSVSLSLQGGTNGSGQTYQWQESPNGTTFSNISGATSRNYTSGPVNSSRSYRVIVTCGTQSATSNAVAVTVLAITYATLPFIETFENTWLDGCGTRNIPSLFWRGNPVTGNNSWRRNDDGSSANWSSLNSYAYSPTGSQSMHSARFHSGAASNGLIGTLDLYVNMSGTGSRELSFNYINTSGADSLTVQVSTDGGLTFGPQLLRLGVSGTGFQVQTLTLTSTSPTTVIRFRGRADSGSTDIGLDNVAIAACPRVSNVAASNITSSGATVTFTPVPGVSSYTVVATPATGPPVTVTPAPTGSPVQITGLQGFTEYTVSVVSNCGPTQSSAPVTATFTTLIPPSINDEPCDATALTPLASPITGSNLGASASSANGYANPGCAPASNPRDVWFRFVAPATTGSLGVVVAGNPAGQVRLFSASSCNGPFTQLACQASSGPNTAAGPLRLPNLTAGATYYVAVSGYGSSDTQGSFTIAISSVLSTSQNTLPSGEINLYPNPSHDGTLTMSLRDVATAGVVQAELLNALGQQVLTEKIQVRGGVAEKALPVQKLAKGFYTLRVRVGEYTITRKVVLD